MSSEPTPIPLHVPELAGNEWTYVKDCLDGGWVSSAGAYVDRFESVVAERCGARHGVAVVNGTAALHLALRVVGVEPDDEVLVSTLTFIAPANAIRHAGAWPVFVDAEPAHWQMDPTKLEGFLAGCRVVGGALRNPVTGRRVRAIVPVHVLGHPCDLDAIATIARRYELPIVEDAAESLGAAYRGRPLGGALDIACLSFNGNKIVTTGGGGMILARDGALAARAKHLSTQAKISPDEYVHDEVGYNYRLTNLQAAVGCAQLERLDGLVAAKRRIALRYDAELAGIPGLERPREAPWATSIHWLYTVLAADRVGLRAALAAARIQTRPLWQPLHLNAPYRDAPRTDCSTAEAIYARALSLPSSPALSSADQDRVIAAVRAWA